MSGREERNLMVLFILAATMLSARPGVAQQAKPAARSEGVATFSGTLITEDELMRAAAGDLEKLELQRLQLNANLERARQEILEWNLSRLIEGKVLAAEAAKRGVNAEALLAKELEGKVKEPSQQDVNAYYVANKAHIGKPLEDVSSQILQYLKNENYNKAKAEYVESLKNEYGVSSRLEPLRMKVDTGGSPSSGPADARVTMIEFSDFQCPYCANLSKTLRQVLNSLGKDVRLVYRQFPLSQIHPFAEQAAEASLCAADQGHFWEMHDLMFQDQGKLADADLKADASRLNLDLTAFDECLSSRRHAEKIKADMREGASLGVAGTPALFINGRMMSGAQSYEDLTRVINEEIAKKSDLSLLKK
jgi:protein-disulfide isomerase